MRNPSKNPLAWAAVGAVATVLLKVLIGGTIIVWGAKTITLGVMDSGMVAAVLTPTLSAYVASRHSSMRPHDEAKQ